jgi:hypothetical protein
LAALEVVSAVAPMEATAMRAITIFFIASPFPGQKCRYRNQYLNY